jgi:hypothetical protein
MWDHSPSSFAEGHSLAAPLTEGQTGHRHRNPVPCPAHKGIIGNEKADEWAKLAAEEPDAHGVEWLGYADRYGRRSMPLPRSLANIKREISEKKWITAKKYRMPGEQRSNGVVDRCSKRLAGRFHQLKNGALSYRAILEVDEEPGHSEVRVVPVQGTNAGASVQELSALEAAAENPVGGVRGEAGRGKNRFKNRDLFADERCTRAILDFLRTTEVGIGQDRTEHAGWCNWTG